MRKYSLLFIIAGIVMIFLLSSVLYHERSSLAYPQIITFLSITLGFSITALSVIATSSHSKRLFSLVDPYNESKTKLERLIFFFKVEIFCSLIAIVLILFSYHIKESEIFRIEIFHYVFTFKSLISGCIWVLTYYSIIFFMMLIRIFTREITENAKEYN